MGFYSWRIKRWWRKLDLSSMFVVISLSCLVAGFCCFLLASIVAFPGEPRPISVVDDGHGIDHLEPAVETVYVPPLTTVTVAATATGTIEDIPSFFFANRGAYTVTKVDYVDHSLLATGAGGILGLDAGDLEEEHFIGTLKAGDKIEYKNKWVKVTEGNQ